MFHLLQQRYEDWSSRYCTRSRNVFLHRCHTSQMHRMILIFFFPSLKKYIIVDNCDVGWASFYYMIEIDTSKNKQTNKNKTKLRFSPIFCSVFLCVFVDLLLLFFLLVKFYDLWMLFRILFIIFNYFCFLRAYA